MSKKEKPLPKPPKTPFGRQRRFEEGEESTPLLADEIAKAMAEGNLDEFMKHEIPDNEHARKLVSMMMGMSGMQMPENIASKPEKKEETARPPEDVLTAVQAGDVGSLMELLRSEHEKRTTGKDKPQRKKKAKEKIPELSSPEKKVLDELMKIASENNVSIDWITLRALKMYVHGYKKTGKL